MENSNLLQCAECEEPLRAYGSCPWICGFGNVFLIGGQEPSMAHYELESDDPPDLAYVQCPECDTEWKASEIAQAVKDGKITEMDGDDEA